MQSLRYGLGDYECHACVANFVLKCLYSSNHRNDQIFGRYFLSHRVAATLQLKQISLVLKKPVCASERVTAEAKRAGTYRRSRAPASCAAPTSRARFARGVPRSPASGASASRCAGPQAAECSRPAENSTRVAHRTSSAQQAESERGKHMRQTGMNARRSRKLNSIRMC